jgi:hypothetical protein
VAEDERLAGERVGREGAKKSAAAAMSALVVNSPSTVSFSITFLITSSSLIPSAFACSGICLSTSGVRTKPGQMTLARTLCLAPSLAITLARPISPCLAATYGALSNEASFECTDPMRMMLPPRPDAYMCGRHALVVRNAPSRWIASIFFHSANGNSSIGWTIWTPALLTRMSTPPHAFTTAATPAFTCPSSLTSIPTAIALAPISAATSLAAARFRSTTATFAPSRA